MTLSPIQLSLATTFDSNIPDIGQTGDWAITSSDEKVMGDALMQQIQAADLVTRDPVVNEYLDTLSKRMQNGAPPMDNPLHYFCVDSDVLNAFAFFGGHIAVHSGLIVAAESESELAAVLAHETAHIAQRHLARIVTNNKKLMPLTAAEIVAALALGILGGSPEAGMHLASAAMGSHVQNLINYTRTHEREADRIGIQILDKAGFDPAAMPAIFGKLAAKAKYQSKPPEYLLTHPVFEERIADATNRVEKMGKRKVEDNLSFHLIRARLVAATQENAKRRVQRIRNLLEAEKHANKTLLEYTLALSLMKNRQYADAEKLMRVLCERYPTEWLFQFGLGEIAFEKGDINNALTHFKSLYDKEPKNYSVALTYAEALLEAKDSNTARDILMKNQKSHAKDPNLFVLLTKAHRLTGHRVELHQTQAEWHFLRGEYPQTFQQLDLALEKAKPRSQQAAQIAMRKQNLQELVKNQKKL